MRLYGISVEDVKVVIVNGKRMESQGNRERAIMEWSNGTFQGQSYLRVVWVIEGEEIVVISVHPRRKGS